MLQFICKILGIVKSSSNESTPMTFTTVGDRSLSFNDWAQYISKASGGSR